MNRRATIPFVFTILAALSSALAQTPPPSANSGGPATAPPQEETKPPMRANRAAPAEADARQCLELPTNLEVIKCAEKYRPHKRST
jgi:hypothetical protein